MEYEPYALIPESYEINVKPGESFTISAQLETWNGERTEVQCTVVSITDGFIVESDGEMFTVNESGKGKVILRWEGDQYSIVSTPIEITVGKQSGGCGSFVGSSGYIFLLPVAYWLLKKRFSND